MTELPQPTTARWRPLRLGLVDLFYYDDEQFWFHDGRLLLRGNNGTGKSKVLALTLPFLLDGSTQPRRVEPDADAKKKMDWNLLLGGAYPGSERTGYSWVEFGRVDPDGTQRFTTLGIGLKAARGRGIVKTWYFITERRIGDLQLLDAQQTVLSQERLRDELAGTGQVLTTRESYRRAVDEALFRLGDERYGALVDLLIQLRQPQLSKRPDERGLSVALTEALRPLDQAVIADVAESFRSLEEERDGIGEAKDTFAAANAFLSHYRAYAAVAARRHATAVRTSHSAYEQSGRELSAAQEQLAEAVAEGERLAAEHAADEERQADLLGRERALRDSPEARDADRLDDARRQSESADEQSGGATAERDRAHSTAERETAALAAAEDEYAKHSDGLARLEGHAGTLAMAAGIGDRHADLVHDEHAAQRAVARRLEQLQTVRKLARVAHEAHVTARSRGQAVDSAQGQAGLRADAVSTAHAAVDTAIGAYGDALSSHLGKLVELRVEDRNGLVQQAVEWAGTVAGQSPAATELNRIATQRGHEIAQQAARAASELEDVDARLTELRERISQLESGYDPEPPAAPGREPQARVSRPGAPLWRLADFRDGVSDDDRAGIEAALQSAGLIDAWVFPDGTVETAGDVVLSGVAAGDSRGAEEGGAAVTAAGGATGRAGAESSLAELLVAAPGPGDDVPHDTVDRVLSAIALCARDQDGGDGLWVSADGRWGAGPARGSWAKAGAEYLGAGARDAHRRRVLEELIEREAQLEDLREQARRAIGTAAERERHVAREIAAYPTGAQAAVTDAHAQVTAANAELERANQQVQAAQTAWDEAIRAAEAAQGELDQTADELRAPVDEPGLDDAVQAVHSYAHALVQVRTAATTVKAIRSQRDETAARHAEAAQNLERWESAVRERANTAARLRSRYEELRATVGTSVAELERRLEANAAQKCEVGKRLAENSKRTLDAAGRRGNLTERVSGLQERRAEAALVRGERIDELREFARTGLLRVAGPEGLDPADEEAWSVAGGVTLARGIESELHEHDESDGAWNRAQQRVSTAYQELSTQMSRHGHMAVMEQRGDVMVVSVRYRQDEIEIDRLAERLRDDVAERERLLTEREREILENHLVNEVAGHLHELLTIAQSQIDRMNDELAVRKTSTGMQLRVQWREHPDAPAGLGAARSLLLRSDATWTSDDRTAIANFLQAQITRVRQEDPTGSWQEHLDRALDYRQWHTFAVELKQHGQWRSASGPASGGERALAVTVPLFAAASTHYNSADEHAPRLILLDEAFAGVDDDSRAKSLGLLATFDLDVVMTSEREWGCYPEVPGLAIAQLSRVEGIDAVGVTRWLWDGTRRSQQDDVPEAARAGMGGGDHDDAQPGPGLDLFG